MPDLPQQVAAPFGAGKAALGTLLALCLAGCLSRPASQEAGEPLFYPPAPAQPRIQLLATFSASSEVGERQGRFERFIVGPEADKPILKPYGLAAWEDRLYICDSILGDLVVVDFRQRQLRYLSGSGPRRLLKPINIAVDEQGNKYVTDTGREAVVVFDARDRYCGELPLARPLRPVGVAATGGKVYVTDLESRSVLLWDARRREVAVLIQDSEESRLLAPVDVAVGPEGEIFVSDLGGFTVREYDPQGRFVRAVGSQGDASGQFARPKGIDLDDQGRLYVTDAATELVQVFDREGRLLLYFGQPGIAQFSLGLPAQVLVNRSLLPFFAGLADPAFRVEQLLIVSSQYGEHKISVFGFGRSTRP